MNILGVDYSHNFVSQNLARAPNFQLLLFGPYLFPVISKEQGRMRGKGRKNRGREGEKRKKNWKRRKVRDESQKRETNNGLINYSEYLLLVKKTRRKRKILSPGYILKTGS